MKKLEYGFILLIVCLSVMLIAGCEKKTDPPVTMIDKDGNVYETITLGEQVWTRENLRSTRFSDSTLIPEVLTNSAWSELKAPGFCWYGNDALSNKSIYGALYNWYAINSGKLCPKGWHVPTDLDWITLEEYLIAHGFNYDGTKEGNKIAKSLADTSKWESDEIPGTAGYERSLNNKSGFTALPGGYRTPKGFQYIEKSGYWWSSSELINTGLFFNIDNNYSNSFRGNNSKQNGYSVRCLKD